VNDEWVVPVMVDLHRHLLAGSSSAAALAAATTRDGQLDVTGAAFIAIGA
nr:hypothetical protein [Acidimicrobiia bacterium]